jgi:hypothetical protein
MPPGLIVGLVGALISIEADVLYSMKRPVEWTLVCQAGLIASMCIAVSGALELARRLGEMRARAAQLAAIGFGLVALQRLGDLFVPSSRLPVELITAGVVLAGIGLGLAAGNRVLAIAGGVLGLAAIPLPQVMDVPAKTIAVAFPIWTAVALVALHRAVADAAEAPERKDHAVVGLRRASIALWIRLGSASMLLSGMYIAQIRYGMTVAGAAIGALSMVTIASGLVRVASGAGKELPRVWAYIAAFLGLWSRRDPRAARLHPPARGQRERREASESREDGDHGVRPADAHQPAAHLVRRVRHEEPRQAVRAELRHDVRRRRPRDRRRDVLEGGHRPRRAPGPGDGDAAQRRAELIGTPAASAPRMKKPTPSSRKPLLLDDRQLAAVAGGQSNPYTFEDFEITNTQKKTSTSDKWDAGAP